MLANRCIYLLPRLLLDHLGAEIDPCYRNVDGSLMSNVYFGIGIGAGWSRHVLNIL